MISEYFWSTADIRDDDEIYNMVMGWIAEQAFAKESRNFVANTNLNSKMWWLFRYDRDDDDDDDEQFSAKKQEKPLKYTPSFGTHYFWYKGWPITFCRTRDQGEGANKSESISLSIFGRDPTVLKELLDACQTHSGKGDENKTVIYRADVSRKGGDDASWTRSTSRVSRPFSTVVLDEEVKQSVLDDMRDYLNPTTRRWYSARGIPYRRGYLLFGPPGTGKSSLGFAIAGYFDLKIYIVSLNSSALTEQILESLFSEFPKRCVVLLEDIDTAGLTESRDSPSDDDDQNDDDGDNDDDDGDGKKLKRSKKSKKPHAGAGQSRVSPSALLNVIDGVAASEGRILIMTTNHMENLDKALIRPRRVDMTVKFDLASTQIISTIFLGIYSTSDDQTTTKLDSFVFPAKAWPFDKSSALTEPRDRKKQKTIEAKRLTQEGKIQALGSRFAEIVPTMTFSPAEIQGHLLNNKDDPEEAVESAAKWVKATIFENSKKKKKTEKKQAKEPEEKPKSGFVKSLKRPLTKVGRVISTGNIKE